MNIALIRSAFPPAQAAPTTLAAELPTTSSSRSPLFAQPILSYVAQFCDGDTLCELARVCQYLRSALTLQPRFGARVWKRRYQRLVDRCAALKERVQWMQRGETRQRCWSDILGSSVPLPELELSMERKWVESLVDRLVEEKEGEMYSWRLRELLGDDTCAQLGTENGVATGYLSQQRPRTAKKQAKQPGSADRVEEANEYEEKMRWAGKNGSHASW